MKAIETRSVSGKLYRTDFEPVSPMKAIETLHSFLVLHDSALNRYRQ